MVGPPPYSPEKECPVEYVEWVRYALRQSHSFAYGELCVAASRHKTIL